MTLEDLAGDLRRFAAERDWQQFHTPKNLALSLAVEVGELLEHFQWGSDGEIAERLRAADGREAVAEELADVLIYLVRLADVAGVDLLAAASANRRQRQAVPGRRGAGLVGQAGALSRRS